MIGAQTDQSVQEHLIEKYMLLPNQVWDSIIQQATKVSSSILMCPVFRLKMLLNVCPLLVVFSTLSAQSWTGLRYMMVKTEIDMKMKVLFWERSLTWQNKDLFTSDLQYNLLLYGINFSSFVSCFPFSWLLGIQKVKTLKILFTIPPLFSHHSLKVHIFWLCLLFLPVFWKYLCLYILKNSLALHKRQSLCS